MDTQLSNAQPSARLPDCVGLIPAAGRATRLALASGSKELLSVPDLAEPAGTDSPSPVPTVPVCEYLLRQYENAGIRDVALIRRAEKTDVGAYFSSTAMGDRFAVNDLLTPPTPGSVHSLAIGCAQFMNRNIAIGFPDIMLHPSTLCSTALSVLHHEQVDICLAAVPFTPDQRRNWDLCEYDTLRGTADSTGRVTRIINKPETSELCFGWALAVWRPTFSRFLVDFLDDPNGAGQFNRELSMSDVIQAAIDHGLNVQCVNEAGGYALDIGQPERLQAARKLDPQALDAISSKAELSPWR